MQGLIGLRQRRGSLNLNPSLNLKILALDSKPSIPNPEPLIPTGPWST